MKIDFTRATECTPEVEAEIERAFAYQPFDDRQVNAARMVRLTLAEAVKTIVSHCPLGPLRDARSLYLRPSSMAEINMSNEGLRLIKEPGPDKMELSFLALRRYYDLCRHFAAQEEVPQQ